MIKIYDNIKSIQLPTYENTSDKAVESSVAEIIADVRKNGDAALKNYAKKFDNADITELEVTKEEIQQAYDSVDPEFIKILETAAENIRAFHKHQIRSGFVCDPRDGVVLGQKIIAIARVGLYIPGGTAAYPSTVLMNCIPAKLAGVPEIMMVTPPTGGSINPVILAAAKIAGVDRVFRCGGAQAVAALAYGTETIPKADKIVGPGNAYVAEAKRQVFGQVGIDMIAGPSEILIVADGKCDPSLVAADMLSQAEHDKNASAKLITDSAELANAVSGELEKQIPQLPRRDIARASIDNNGGIYVVANLKDAIDLANDIAPEHLELCVDSPFDWLPLIKNAGSVFLGRNCPEALGDYFAGPNHTLPTSGTARFYSALSVDDFVKKTQFIYYSQDALAKEAGSTARFAEAEGLDAHGLSVTKRFGEK